MCFFSWQTQDTKESISNVHSPKGPLPVKMINPVTGEVFKESEYQGRGVFGGKGYYELLAELNGYGPSHDMGVSLDLGEIKGKNGTLWPVLVTIDFDGNYSGFGRAENCMYQGFFY